MEVKFSAGSISLYQKHVSPCPNLYLPHSQFSRTVPGENNRFALLYYSSSFRHHFLQQLLTNLFAHPAESANVSLGSQALASPFRFVHPVHQRSSTVKSSPSRNIQKVSNQCNEKKNQHGCDERIPLASSESSELPQITDGKVIGTANEKGAIKSRGRSLNRMRIENLLVVSSAVNTFSLTSDQEDSS